MRRRCRCRRSRSSGRGRRRRARGRRRGPGPAEQAVAVGVRVDEGAHAAVLQRGDRRRWRACPSSPSSRRWRRCRRGRRRRPPRAPRSARPPRRAGRGRWKAAVPRMTRWAPASTAAWTASIDRSPPPYWTGTPSCGDLREVVDRARLAVAGAVEVDDVQVRGAGLDPVARGLQRRVGVHRLVLEAALDEPHRAAVLDVDGGVEDHAVTKFCSSASPSREDFSGWNCAPKTLPRLDDRRERPRRASPSRRRSASSAGRTTSECTW